MNQDIGRSILMSESSIFTEFAGGMMFQLGYIKTESKWTCKLVVYYASVAKKLFD